MCLILCSICLRQIGEPQCLYQLASDLYNPFILLWEMLWPIVWGDGIKSLTRKKQQADSWWKSESRTPTNYQWQKSGETIKLLNGSVIITEHFCNVGSLVCFELHNSLTWYLGWRTGCQTETELLQLKLGVREQEQSSLRHPCRPSLRPPRFTDEQTET